MQERNKLIIVVALTGIACLALFIAVSVLVPRYYPDFPGGGGICFHKPQEIVDHQIEPKMTIGTYP